MAENVDDKFYERADTFLDVANDMIDKRIHDGKVNASMMFAAARFNTWVAARHAASLEDLTQQSQNVIDHFTQQYRLMLQEHMADHIRHWDGDHKPAS